MNHSKANAFSWENMGLAVVDPRVPPYIIDSVTPWGRHGINSGSQDLV
jgi:hypothetical protein